MKDVIKTPSFIRLSILTVLQAVYAGFAFYIFLLMMYVCYMIVSLMNLSNEAEAITAYPAEIIVLVILLLIPPILGLFLVDRPRWWVRSIPVQILLGIVTIYIGWNLLFYDPDPEALQLFGPISIGFSAILSMLFLLPQAVGVGIKALWLKLKAKKGTKQ